MVFFFFANLSVYRMFFSLPLISRAQSMSNVRKQALHYSNPNLFSSQGMHVHSSSVVELPNGDLLCCWFEGSENVLPMMSR